MRSVTALLLIACLLGGCSSGEPASGSLIVENPYRGALQDDGLPFTFVADQVFGAEEEPAEALLSWVRSAVVDREGNVIVLDGDRLISFSPDGNVRWIHDEQGEGPGEISGAWNGLVYDGGDRFFLNNQQSTRLDMFALDGTFVESIPVSDFGLERLSLVGFLDDGRAVGSAFYGRSYGVQMSILDPVRDWRITDGFSVDQSREGDPVSGGSPGTSLLDGWIAVRNLNRYQITLHESDGDTVRIIRRNVPNYTRPIAIDNWGIAAYSGMLTPVRLASGYTILRASWPEYIGDEAEIRSLVEAGRDGEITPHNTIDIFDRDWRLLYSITGEELDSLALGTPLFADSSGYLYTSQRAPYPRLVRYLVKETVE
jgi:hypothetical protein